jgi:D-lactate dehydrogenase
MDVTSIAITPQSHDAAPDNARFIDQLKSIVGGRHVLSSPRSTLRYRTGFRFGQGPALAVVRPGNLVEQWRVLLACAAADKIIIMQAANTGLTGGSTPDGDDYDRDVVILSTRRMDRIRLIGDGRQVICHPGATLFALEKALKPLARTPHSVIGSSCIGASVLGGVSNNSGGALIHRGPAYTQMTLFARIDATSAVRLVNHLGIRLGDTPEQILAALDHDDFTEAEIDYDPAVCASDSDYARHVRDIDADTPARFNADPRRLFESSGSAGKVMTFAVRLDTFPAEKETKVFYIGTNDPDEFTEMRRHILARFTNLPVSGEYIHRTAYDIAETYGKDMFLAIWYLGTAWLPTLFAIKGGFDAFAGRFRFLPRDLSDRIMQTISGLFPRHLPKRMTAYRDRYEHHLILTMAGAGIDEARRYLRSLYPSRQGDFFECTKTEGTKAALHRFAAAGAAVRYRAVHRRQVEDIVAIDVALRRDDRCWRETLPDEIEAQILHKLYYGHFFCHVFHQDYIVGKGHDTTALEHKMWALLDARGAQYPAEHNFGHLYMAKPPLLEHYKSLDPCNCFNPGIGKASKHRKWQAHCR